MRRLVIEAQTARLGDLGKQVFSPVFDQGRATQTRQDACSKKRCQLKCLKRHRGFFGICILEPDAWCAYIHR